MSCALLKAALPAAAVSAVLVIGAPAPAWSWAWLTTVPSVRVVVPGLASQAQVMQQLQALGYHSVRLASAYPSPANPRPELNATENPATTPVHRGWNGTAVKDGTLVFVCVEPDAAAGR